MPPSKQASHKTPSKSATTHDQGKDLRRAHEHQGRIEVLRSLLGENTSDIDALIKLAQAELTGSHPKDAADLFRAAEHLSFGHLAPSQREDIEDSTLTTSLESEFKHKREKADEHWESSEALETIYQDAITASDKAFYDGAYRKALELARAAEALAHVHLHHA